MKHTDAHLPRRGRDLPLRVCHLGKYYPPAAGGIESHVRTLAQAQARQGHEVRVICTNHVPGPTTREHDGDVAVTRTRRSSQVAKFDICPELVRELRCVRADILHLQLPNPTMVAALVIARARTPLVVTYQSDHVRQRVRAAAMWPFERHILGRAGVIVATSPTYVGGSRVLRAHQARVRVVPMGIEPAPYACPSAEDRAFAAALSSRYAHPIWVACGRLVYYKGLINAVRALPHVPGTLLVLGDGPERRALVLEAQRLDVAHRVVMVGAVRQHEAIPYFLAAHALWFPSNARSEAFGLVQVEAMACGCPVINTSIRHSGVAWVSPHDQTGITVPPDDPAALADAARRLWESPHLRDRLGRAGHARVLEEFDDSTMARRCLELYSQLLVRPRRCAPGGQGSMFEA